MSTSEPLVQSVLLGEAVEHAPVAILVADDEMRYVAANATACELLGYSREELLRLRVPDLAQYPEAEGEFEAMIAAGELIGRTTVRGKDGKPPQPPPPLGRDEDRRPRVLRGRALAGQLGRSDRCGAGALARAGEGGADEVAEQRRGPRRP